MRLFDGPGTQPVGDAARNLGTSHAILGTSPAGPLRRLAAWETVASGKAVRGRTMSEHDTGYDHTRYQKLLAEAVDEKKRLELIDLLIAEKARDRLQEQRLSD